MDRKEAGLEKNKIKELYNEQRVKMEKAGASVEQLEKLKKLFNAKIGSIDSSIADNLSGLNRGEAVRIAGGTTSGLELNQASLPDMANVKGLGKEGMFKKLGKSMKGGKAGLALGAIGALAGAALPEESQAAEIMNKLGEAAEGVDLQAQATKAFDKVAPVEELMAAAQREKKIPGQALAELKARSNYLKSPASDDRAGIPRQQVQPQVIDEEDESGEINQDKKNYFNRLKQLFNK